MRTPEVSVVVPAYNAKEFIIPTLESIIRQKVHRCRYEIVVVNDGSTDGTRTILHGVSSCLSGDFLRILDQDNQGPSSAINHGVANSRGRKIVVCDSDDMLYPEAVEELCKALNRTPFATAEKAGIRNEQFLYTSINRVDLIKLENRINLRITIYFMQIGLDIR